MAGPCKLWAPRTCPPMILQILLTMPPAARVQYLQAKAAKEGRTGVRHPHHAQHGQHTQQDGLLKFHGSRRPQELKLCK